MKISKDIYAVGGRKNGAVVLFNKSKDGPKHTDFKQNNVDTLVDNKWLPWGNDNLYPQNFSKKFKKAGVAIGGVDVLIAAHFGSGFQLFQGIETKDGINFRERLPSSFPDINDFLNRTKYNAFNSDIIVDFETWGMAFPIYLLSPNGDKIISVRRTKTADIRFEAQINLELSIILV